MPSLDAIVAALRGSDGVEVGCFAATCFRP